MGSKGLIIRPKLQVTSSEMGGRTATSLQWPTHLFLGIVPGYRFWVLWDQALFLADSVAAYSSIGELAGLLLSRSDPALLYNVPNQEFPIGMLGVDLAVVEMVLLASRSSLHTLLQGLVGWTDLKAQLSCGRYGFSCFHLPKQNLNEASLVWSPDFTAMKWSNPVRCPALLETGLELGTRFFCFTSKFFSLGSVSVSPTGVATFPWTLFTELPSDTSSEEALLPNIQFSKLLLSTKPASSSPSEVYQAHRLYTAAIALWDLWAHVMLAMPSMCR